MGRVMVGYNITLGGWNYVQGDYIIHSPVDDERQVHNARVEMRANGISTLTFTMAPNHPYVSRIELLRYSGWQGGNSVNLYFDDKQLFHGVVTSKSEDMDGQISVECRDDLTLLENALVIPSVGETTAYLALSNIIEKYNEMAPNGMKFRVRQAPQENVSLVEFVKPTSVWDIIKKTMIDPFDCSVRIVGDSDGYRNIYVQKLEEGDPEQTVTFGDNLIDYQSEVFTSELYTAVVPVGGNYNIYTSYGWNNEIRMYRAASVGDTVICIYFLGTFYNGDVLLFGEDEYIVESSNVVVREIDSSEKRYLYTEVVIKSAVERALSANQTGRKISAPRDKLTRPRMLDNVSDRVITDSDGRTYIKRGITLYDRDAVARYGFRAYVLDMPDEKHSDTLLASALESLHNHPKTNFTLEVSAVDMALYSSGYEHMAVGESVRVVSEPHGIDTVMVVTGMSIDLDDVGNTKYTFGMRPDTVSGKIEKGRLGLALLDNNLTYRT